MTQNVNICLCSHWTIARKGLIFTLRIIGRCTWHIYVLVTVLNPTRLSYNLRNCDQTPAACGNRKTILFNTLRPRQNGRHFPDDIFRCIFLTENVWISLKISLKFISKGPINNMSALVQIMAWRLPGDKPLSEPMMVSLLAHICVIRPKWVLNVAVNKRNISAADIKRMVHPITYPLCYRFCKTSTCLPAIFNAAKIDLPYMVIKACTSLEYIYFIRGLCLYISIQIDEWPIYKRYFQTHFLEHTVL